MCHKLNKVDQRVITLIRKLEDSGWKNDCSDFYSFWWADFIYKFNSEWSPTSKCFYLIGLVDPQNNDLEIRKTGKGIWAISINNKIPKDRNDYVKCWTLKEIGKDINLIISECAKFKT